MKEIEGDLIELAKAGCFDVIAHGANCFHTMGKGFALAVRRAFPAAYLADLGSAYGSTAKLGALTTAIVTVAGGRELTIVNAYTQYRYGYGLQLDMLALERALETIKRNYGDKRIGMVRIGCSNAGGSWAVVKPLMESCLKDCDVTIVTPPERK